MGKIYITLALVLGIMGCTSNAPVPNPLPAIGCSAETAITSGVAASIATALNCTSLISIQGDIQAALGKANLCQAAAPVAGSKKLKGPIGDLVCPLATSAVSAILTGKIPASWVCDPSAKIADVSLLLNTACSKALGI